MNDITESVQYKEEVLEWIKFGCMQKFSTELMSDICMVKNFMRQTTLVQVRANLLSKPLPSRDYQASGTFSVEIPRSTWQMFKRTHDNSWWLRRLVARWPVEYVHEYRTGTVRVDLTDVVVFPWQTLVPKESRLGTPVRIVTVAESWDWREGSDDV